MFLGTGVKKSLPCVAIPVGPYAPSLSVAGLVGWGFLNKGNTPTDRLVLLTQLLLNFYLQVIFAVNVDLTYPLP